MHKDRSCRSCRYRFAPPNVPPCAGCYHNDTRVNDKPLSWEPEATEGPVNQPDPTNPPHYKTPGPEVIQLTRHLNFNRGNAVKYLCRAGKKGDEVEDLKKALWYVADEIQRLTGEGEHAKP